MTARWWVSLALEGLCAAAACWGFGCLLVALLTLDLGWAIWHTFGVAITVWAWRANRANRHEIELARRCR